MNPARIFCIGRNYAEHVAELAQPGAADDGDCVIFMKPASAVVPEDEPIVLPRGLGSVHFEAELVVVGGPEREHNALQRQQQAVGSAGRHLQDARAKRSDPHRLRAVLRVAETRGNAGPNNIAR